MVTLSKGNKYRLKIVLYGPTLSGKTTMVTKLPYIFPDIEYRIFSVVAPDGRTLFFDYIILKITKIRRFVFDIFTVPGYRRYVKLRKAILTGTDCVIFVADSDPKALTDNVLSFNELKNYLKTSQRIPIVIAVNKRDLREALPIKTIMRSLRIDYPAPIIPTIAIQGIGLWKVFREAIRLSILSLFFPMVYDVELERIRVKYRKMLPIDHSDSPLIKL